MRVVQRRISGACAALILATSAAAQNYPAQPIRAVVGYAAGGGADGMIRAISNELAEALGQPVIIDNRPGGGTVIATKIVADSKPDGYTIYVADPALIFNPYLLPKVPYDAVRDFAPVVAVTFTVLAAERMLRATLVLAV